METVADLVQKFAKPGRIEWIGVRPSRYMPLIPLDEVHIRRTGLVGDHRSKAGKRTVTLIQAEHLPVIAALCLDGATTVAPGRLRRNIVVSGISLLALRNAEFHLGGALLRGSGLCAPCSRMEAELGHGGYNAMRGHGGICAEVLEEGTARIGDSLAPISLGSAQNGLPLKADF